MTKETTIETPAAKKAAAMPAEGKKPAAKKAPAKKPATRKPRTATVAAPAARKPEAPAVELFPLLLDALKERGLELEVRSAPATAYSSLLVDGTNIAYVYTQTRAGLRVAPAATLEDLKGAAQKKLFGVRKERSKRFAIVAVAATAKDILVIADVLQGSAERLGEAAS